MMTLQNIAMLSVIILVVSLLLLILAENRLDAISQYISSCGSSPKSPKDKANYSNPDIDSEKTKEKHWHSEESRHHKIERFFWGITAALTFVAAIGAIATIMISNWSLDEARTATKEARRQADAACKAYEPTLIIGGISLYRLTPKPTKADVPDFQIWVKFLNIGGNSAVANSWAINVSQVHPPIPYQLPTENYKENINVFFRPTTDIKDASPVPLLPKDLLPKVLDSVRGKGIPKYWFYGYIKYRDTWSRSYTYNFCQTTHLDGIVVGESIPPEGEAIPIESCSTEEYGDYVSQADTQRISTARVSQNGC